MTRRLLARVEIKGVDDESDYPKAAIKIDDGQVVEFTELHAGNDPVPDMLGWDVSRVSRWTFSPRFQLCINGVWGYAVSSGEIREEVER
jgi:hypothetical protein